MKSRHGNSVEQYLEVEIGEHAEHFLSIPIIEDGEQVLFFCKACERIHRQIVQPKEPLDSRDVYGQLVEEVPSEVVPCVLHLVLAS